MNSYSGDEKFSKALERAGSPMSLAEVKAYLMGTIAATWHAPMQAVFDHIKSGKEFEYEDKEQMMHFMGNLMGLWNELTRHQEANNPFRFARLEIAAAPAAIKKALASRTAEIKQFIRGLDAGGTDPLEFSKEGQESFRYLAEADAIFQNVLKVSETDKDVSEATLKALVGNLLKVDEIIHDCVHRIVLEAKSVRLKRMEAVKEKEILKERLHHVGRNEPCPCGSGIKFKKCCLPKTQ